MTNKKSLSEEIQDIVTGKANVSEDLNPKDRELTPKARTSNHGTLSPGSKHKDPMIKSPAEVVDLGTGPVKPGETNPDPNKGTKGKDSSKSSKTAVGPEKIKKLSEEETVVEENDVAETITEEDIENFRAELVAEGYDESEIATIIDNLLEDYEEVTEDNDDILTEDEIIAFAQDLEKQGATEDQIQEAIDELLSDYELISEETEVEDEVPEYSYPTMDFDDIDLTNDIEALTTGQELSEEFKEKAKLIFETSLKAKLTDYQNQLDTAFQGALSEAIGEIETKLEESVNDYLHYVAESWLENNEVAVESGLRTELTEEFIEDFFNLCRNHYIDVPEDKVNIIEQLVEKVESLEDQLNEEIETNVRLNKIINESQKEVDFYSLTDGLTDTQVEQLKKLAENVEYISEEDFSNKITTLRESYFPNNGTVSKEVETLEVLTEDTDTDSRIDKYARVIGKSLPN